MVGDGQGRVVHGKVCEVARGRVAVAVERREELAQPRPRFVVVQALAKAGRDEAAIEAMTEVGVDEVIGWEAARSIAKWTDRTSAKWQSTVREAAKQSRRAWVPTVTGPLSTTRVAERMRQANLAVVLEPQAGNALASVSLPEDGDVIIVVGPEGGMAPEELSAFAEAGAAVGRLGESVLRSSTAGVAALAVLSAMRRWR
jgi:16S rRNA (uracil1498-N3)-methyltransferase